MTDRQPITVVVVDDEDDIRELLRFLFGADERFEMVGEADDGEEAVRLVRELKPDAVVLDLQLPILDGLSAIDFMRADSPDTRIVIFSAFPDPFTLIDVLEHGAHALLNKAVAYSELLPTVASLCDRRVSEVS